MAGTARTSRARPSASAGRAAARRTGRGSPSATGRAGPTCCRARCRAGATCSTSTRSTRPTTAMTYAGAAPTAWSSLSGSRSKTLAIAIGAAALAAAPGAARAAAPRVQAMIVHRSGAVFGPRSVGAGATRVRRCRVPAATPLAVLAALGRTGGPSFRASGACSALYVFQVGGDRARGRAGWVYKVGHRLGTTAAADPSGPFGTGRRLRSGQHVTWFWCVSAARCQRTLAVSGVPRRTPRGRPLRVTVRAYDDNGRSVPAADASVALGTSRAVTGRDGRARLIAPRRRGSAVLRAARRGLVPAFPVRVAIT